MRSRLSALWARLLTACFQCRCVGCKAWGTLPVCARCAETLPRFSPDACPRCMGDLRPCPLCNERPPFERVHALAPYEGLIRLAILAMKFDRRPEVADWLGDRLADSLPSLDADWILVPIPLSPERLAERGFNQAELLAQRIRGRRVETRWLRRTRSTPSQVGQAKAERWQSLAGAFEASPKAQGRRILLVDDVLTSGATLSWAAHALKNAGAVEVRAVVAARTPLINRKPPTE